MAVIQTLTVTSVSGSVDAASNTSKVRIQWTSTQTGDSWNGYKRQAKLYISYNGGAESEQDISYTLPKASTVTIVDTTVTVKHRDDGTGTISVSTWMDTGISAGVVQKFKSLTLPQIPRASTITSASVKTLGEACSVAWVPKASTFTYKLVFTHGGISDETPVIKPNTTSLYTYSLFRLPLDVAWRMPNETQGTVEVSLYTYSDSDGTVQVGSPSTQYCTTTVPCDERTKPSVSMPLTNVISLGSPFNAFYIQGKSRVKADLSGEGQYGATITATELYVDGKRNGTLVSDYLSKSGKVTVKGRVFDSRGFYNEATEEIDVIPYSTPQVRPVENEKEVIAARCDKDGNISSDGTYLVIKAKRHYSLVQSGGTQYNQCQLRYRYKEEGGEYNAWATILDYSATSDEVVTSPLLGGGLNTQKTYFVQVEAVDKLLGSSVTTIDVPTDKVYMHKAGNINSLGIGKYVTEENAVDIAEDMEVIARGGFRAIEIPESTDLNSLTKPNNYFGKPVNASSYANCPIGPEKSSTFALEVISLGGGDQILQRLTVCSDLATVYERQHYGGKWVVPWECVNPPMYTGVEYRTKERYKGQAVYTKLVDLGNLPNATRKEVAHGVSAEQVIRCCGQTSNGVSLPFHYDNTDWAEIYANGTNIVVLTGNDQSASTAIAQIWYIK